MDANPLPAKPPAKKEAAEKRDLVKSLYYALSTLTPKPVMKALGKKIKHAGLVSETELWLGPIVLLAILCAAACYLALVVLARASDIRLLGGVPIFAAFMVVFSAYMHLYLKSEDRRKRVDVALPDALRIMAANMRAGMTPIIALRLAARPEFGPLEEEIRYATAKSLGTDSFADVLLEMSERTNSETFNRIVSLLIASLKSGGRLADLLENTADDLIEGQQLKNELQTNTRLFSIFIIFTVMIGTPLLLSVSLQFVKIVSKVQKDTAHSNTDSLTAQAGLGGGLISTPFSYAFVESVAYTVIVVTSILVSVLIGVMSEGKYLTGLKYAPIIMGVTLVIFYILKTFLVPSILSFAR